MIIKTSELTDLSLDWAVAHCVNAHILNCVTGEPITPLEFAGLHDVGWNNYSSDWDQGGSIIEDHDISMIRLDDGYVLDSNGYATGERTRVHIAVIGGCFGLETFRNSYGEDWGKIYHIDTLLVSNGPTALIAAMRCFVESKMGNEVDIPEELT
jgi:hypothetical protein